MSNMDRSLPSNAWFFRRLGSDGGMHRRTIVSRLVRYCLLLSLCLPCALAMEPVTLTDQHPVASMAIDPKVIATGSPILEVDVTEVSNPSLVPIGVAVFITAGDLKIPVGNFAFFPVDYKGNFLLNSKAALARVSKSSNARLVFELRKLRASAEWKPVRVTIAPPKWRTQ
jgi:hypothetical protein